MAKGKIVIIYGPMFAKKTREFLDRIAHEKETRRSVAVFGYKKDTRYAEDSIVTHVNSIGQQQQMRAIKCDAEHLADHRELMLSVDVIGIDEAQFFSGSAPLILELFAAGKTVYLAMLITTFEQKLWPGSPFLELLPFAEVICKVAICDLCFSHDATCSYRKNASTEVEQIGTNQEYGAACYDCLEKAKTQYVGIQTATPDQDLHVNGHSAEESIDDSSDDGLAYN